MKYFVTGTDTDSGKTLVTSALLYKMSQNQAYERTLGLKPVASGCEQTEIGLRNSDALALIEESSIKLDYDLVNPISFLPGIAPHIAASQVGVDISPGALLAKIQLSLAAAELNHNDVCLIEGAGGWRLPLGGGHFLSELVQALDMPVILVVGVKLGCLNHAVLTHEAIIADGLTVAGWVANIVEPQTSCLDENLASLFQLMPSPCLGVVPYLSEVTAKAAAEHLSLATLVPSTI
ncbi:dethiobiotin synthase [Shewanella violacea]|uniref:ATP-dependent dethiobiotin synthetase BioD n=1 Tax=Shewanella violacea (strain JCM 10179 / CIP 106290 / LMG 19151 / DSS12) TaxID=637905 RepID=D4ZLX8_SHEVD|nr:dethiobiotin synthase [Shewanella violacea]BAJ02677.1 dethiobiotin synthase [Shewanella violacea DSS12]